MSIEDRIRKLEGRAWLEGDDAPASIPDEWLVLDPITGRAVGPPQGETMTPAQQRTFDVLAIMDASVPYCPG